MSGALKGQGYNHVFIFSTVILRGLQVSGFWGWMGEVSRCTAFVLDPLYVLQLPATTEHQMSYLKVLRLKCSVTFWGA
eukprot:scaffold296384_cov10-Tisochrysis_lutea.AAC.1